MIEAIPTYLTECIGRLSLGVRRAFRLPCSGIAIVLTLLLPATEATAQSADRYQQVIVAADRLDRLPLLPSFDPHLIQPVNGGVETILSESDVRRLMEAGAVRSVVVEDLGTFYVQRSEADLETHEAFFARLLDDESPENFKLGSFHGFYTLDEVAGELSAMRDQFPELVSEPISIGKSVEGRDILAIRLSGQPSSAELPEVFYTGMHHAREPMSMMSLYYFMWHLLEEYGNDPEITALLDNRALWFVPMVNPDGYQYNVTYFPEGVGFWRKNRGGIDHQGVDLNRNYSVSDAWGVAEEPGVDDPASGSYRGEAPFSEPETRAIRDFVASHRFRTAFNLHSLSNVLIYMHRDPIQELSDTLWYVTAVRELTLENGFGFGKGEEAIGYRATGTAEEWFFEQTAAPGRIFAWAPEIGTSEDGLWPVPSRIPAIARTTVPMLIRGAWMAGPYPRITFWQRGGSDDAYIDLTVKNIGTRPMTKAATLSIDGVDTPMKSVPALLPGESVHLRLPLPETLTGLETPRTELTTSIAYGEGLASQRRIDPMLHKLSTAFEDDFEGNLGFWQNDLWGIETSAPEGRVLSTSPYEPDFRSDSPNILELRDPVSLSGFDAAELRFDASVDVRGVHDFMQIEARLSSQRTWRRLDGEYLQTSMQSAGTTRSEFRGVDRVWNSYAIPLDEFAGLDVLLRFTMNTPLIPGSAEPLDGVQIDNLRIVGALAPPSGTEEPASPAGKDAILVRPNPCTSYVRVNTADPSVEISVQIVDMLGRNVGEKRGFGQVNLSMRDLPSGPYLLTATTGNSTTTQLVVHR